MKKPKKTKRPICPRCKLPCDKQRNVKGKFAGVECWHCGFSGTLEEGYEP